MNSSGKVLILGASGGIGGEVARRLVADNWQVRALKRGAQIRGPADGMQWIAGDALNAGQVAAAAAGCTLSSMRSIRRATGTGGSRYCPCCTTPCRPPNNSGR